VQFLSEGGPPPGKVAPLLDPQAIVVEPPPLEARLAEHCVLPHVQSQPFQLPEASFRAVTLLAVPEVQRAEAVGPPSPMVVPLAEPQAPTVEETPITSTSKCLGQGPVAVAFD